MNTDTSGLPQAAVQYLRNNARLLYLLFNEDGGVIDANEYSQTLIGKDIIASGMQHIFIDFNRTVNISSLRLHPEKPHLLSISTASGLPESFIVHCLPVGEDTLFLGSATAEETRKLQQELLVLNNQLSVLTRDLQKKNHQLVELNTLKNQFLGMAAHDLRNPVSAILSFSEFLLDETGDALSPEHRNFLRIIHSSTDLMGRLIDNFLNVSLIESGRFQLNLDNVDILRPVERSIALQRIIAEKKSVTLRLDVSCVSAVLSMDEAKIEQVLNNLISNAVDHSPPHSEVIIGIINNAENVVVSVTDSGPGIAEEERERIFALFERGKARKPAGTRSSGLGLAISKKIIEAHKGRIWVENRIGQGASFYFQLALSIAKKEDAT